MLLYSMLSEKNTPSFLFYLSKGHGYDLDQKLFFKF